MENTETNITEQMGEHCHVYHRLHSPFNQISDLRHSVYKEYFIVLQCGHGTLCAAQNTKAVIPAGIIEVSLWKQTQVQMGLPDYLATERKKKGKKERVNKKQL